MADIDEIRERLDADEEQLIEELDDIISDIHDDLENILLTDAVGSVDVEDLAEKNIDAINRFYEVLWTTLGLAVENFPDLKDEINTSARVNFKTTDYDIGTHLIIDADEKTVSGDSTALDDPDVEFVGPAEVIVGMTTGQIDGTEAFMQGRFEMEGDMQKGMEFGNVMESVTETLEQAR